MVTKEDVNSYFDSSNFLYSLFYYNKSSLSMHHGFWNKDTENINEASLNENDYIAKLGNFKKNQKLLDAGCGVGGTSIFLAKKYGFQIIGISLNQKQVNLARKYARQRKISDLTEFFRKDYTDTKFADESFDAIYAIESVCHSPSKKEFLEEAFRLLKPKGKLIVADGYLKRLPKTAEERLLIERYTRAFAIPQFVTAKEMLKQIKQRGFVNAKNINMFQAVLPSVKYLYDYAQNFRWIRYLSWLSNKYLKGVLQTYTALTLELKAHKLGLFDYAVQYAEKQEKQ